MYREYRKKIKNRKYKKKKQKKLQDIASDVPEAAREICHKILDYNGITETTVCRGII